MLARLPTAMALIQGLILWRRRCGAAIFYTVHNPRNTGETYGVLSIKF